MLQEWVLAAWRWIATNWAEAFTAIATCVTALIVYFDRWDRRRAEEPFVECAVSEPDENGWVTISITARNYHPYAINLTEIRVKSPRDGVIWSERSAFENDGPNYDPRQRFVATKDKPRRSEAIGAAISPYGSDAAYAGRVIKVAEGDLVTRRFYFSTVSRRPAVKLRMSLMWEVRSREVRQQAIPIKRTIKLENAKSTG